MGDHVHLSPGDAGKFKLRLVPCNGIVKSQIHAGGGFFMYLPAIA